MRQAGFTGPRRGPVIGAETRSFKLLAVYWRWPNRFALGKVGLLVGLPDEGKGQPFCDIAARVTKIGHAANARRRSET